VVEDAQTLGSLELAGYGFGWEEVRAARNGAPAPLEIARLQQAQRALPREAPLDAAALLAWHRVVTGTDAGFRRRERERDGGPPPAPAAFVESRVRLLGEWLASESCRELQPARAGALALARIVEILPFDQANGRVARLAASHAMVRAGARPPVLVAGDGARLLAALQLAFRLETEELALLLDEASERALDVALQALEKWGSGP
jgi:Fic family protein